ncbi:DNA alkylation repair enzyme [Arthrobacter sp. ov407]|uniref:DNA alkylation repair protein n=1 Tax=Arthrobacter sp. ov407 TaxID=1761748 RepID=UPI00088A0031|nr:DNA alkylation repair protein [Arthrobacter sp. ov407]SDK91470.1 DNA alkylation repair enzyme [Arthrobacter sp. ov407]
MSDAGDFIDLSLQREGSWRRADELRSRLELAPGGRGLRFYGTSVGAVRGTVRDAGRRYPGLSHDEVTALSSELWGSELWGSEPRGSELRTAPVFERRLAAVVLLQANVKLLTNSDLTRLEGFIRDAKVRDLVDPLAVDVVGPLVGGLDVLARVRADSVLDRWMQEPDAWLRRAALLSPLLALRAGAGDWDRFVRHANAVLGGPRGPLDDDDAADGADVRDAVSRVVAEMAKRRPELQFTSVGE